MWSGPSWASEEIKARQRRYCFPSASLRPRNGPVVKVAMAWNCAEDEQVSLALQSRWDNPLNAPKKPP